MKKLPSLLLAACLTAFLAGCGTGGQSALPLEKLVFDRGHGSAWGMQLYIEVTPTEILCARYFPEGSGEQEECQNLPITSQQWQQLVRKVESLALQEDAPNVWQTLFGTQKSDGGLYRKLTLYRQTGDSAEGTLYQWPADPAAQELEQLLEQLLQAALQETRR